MMEKDDRAAALKPVEEPDQDFQEDELARLKERVQQMVAELHPLLEELADDPAS